MVVERESSRLWRQLQPLAGGALGSHGPLAPGGLFGARVAVACGLVPRRPRAADDNYAHKERTTSSECHSEFLDPLFTYHL